ncbi:Protein SYG1 [Spathaspora sp. JA1]|nr:Protein SYG1 [Spathaspora sp. JA1]
MKFGESLNEGLVPEWHDQYVDYKAGKKLIKKIFSLREARHSGNTTDDTTPLLQAVDQRSNYIASEGDNIASDEQFSLDRPLAREGEDISEFPQLRPIVKTRGRSIFDSFTSNKDEDYLSDSEKFNAWLESELQKVNSFFLEKEQDVYERFLLLQDQLYQLRDHKLSIIKEKTKQQKQDKSPAKSKRFSIQDKFSLTDLNRLELPSLPSDTFLKKLRRRKTSKEDDISLHNSEQEIPDVNYAENRIRNGLADWSSQDDDQSGVSDGELDIPNRPQPPETAEQARQSQRRDYTVKKQHFGVPYLSARRQLKDAILEHYRSLALLRSYKNLNRTAFRKITKKYDKLLKQDTMKSFMNRIDNQEYFLTSDLVDKLLNQVEESYIAFFDPDTKDRKHSLEKLKSIAYALNASEIRPPNYYLEFFTSGLALGFGLPLLVLATYTIIDKIVLGILPEGKYLLQIWAGFFLLILMFILFGINLSVFDKFKINYKFIFEFNMSTVLNYKQFWLLPSLAFALLSILGWFSANDFWPNKFAGRDWPWLYLGIIVVVFVWPGKQFYSSSRKWLQVALWRLLLSGFYPVEFRDFFLGDIVCSLTYTMGNISFFFCIYAHHWNGSLSDNPSSDNVCGSSKSRLMGFCSTLPSIWRFMQCVRRYMDTGDWFPHLANMMKYTISAVYQITLSMYRIERINQNKSTFIFFACVNSLYTSAWDIFMDWSLMQSNSKNFLLRDHLFFKRPIYYYSAMIIDVILRFQWIFYAFFNHQIQQSAVTSFCIAVAEIIRRFIWIFFRMENEHCSNVILFRASKDTPLPYSISSKVQRAIKKLVSLRCTTIEPLVIEQMRFPEQEESIGFDQTQSYSTSVLPVTTEQQEEDEEETGEISQIGLNTVPLSGGLPPRLTRRKSTFQTIAESLHNAHIKDFQRKKVVSPTEDESDDEDDEESIITAHRTSTRQSNRSTISRGTQQ